MNGSSPRARRRFGLAFLFLVAAALAGGAEPAFGLRDGDRVVFLGDTLIEREQYHGWLEVMLTSRFHEQDVTFRNFGWSADTPEGASRLGLSLLQAGHEPPDEGWKQLVGQLRDAKPTVVFIGYGMASSFAGEAGRPAFERGYIRLIDTLGELAPDARLVLLGPTGHEDLGPPWPAAATHQADLVRYDEAVARLAEARGLVFVPLLEAFTAAERRPLTDNGIHLHAAGYRWLAETIEQQLLGSAGAWRTSPQAEPLRQAILRKNEWFFHRSRPANMAYIFGFRRKEQGRNAAEVLQFDPLVAAEEKRIAALRGLEPVDVPAVPRRVGNRVAPFASQPHPEFTVAEGFEVTLWAENPLIDKPIQINFDPQGRLWVAASTVYPQIEPGQAATDRILVLEDSTGDGRADRASVFVDDLLIPTGVAPGDGGVYVAQSTELLHFRDHDGDGRADERRVVLSGFGTEDSHHNLHTLRWGPDGRLYMNQSVYTRTDTETPHGVVRLRAGGIFRFDPREERLEILFRGWVNAWGHQFDPFGQSFVTDGAGTEGISWAIPGATYRTLAPHRRVLQTVSPGHYPKFSGLEIIHGGLFPADWQGDMVTCDFRANRVVRFKVSEQASAYVTREMPEVLRTTADSFRPVDVKVGPDGALYIADWSNPIIQHGEVDFRDPRRDKVHGRIWRVAPTGSAALPVRNLAAESTGALLDALLSPHGVEQEHARRVLTERGREAVLPQLHRWLQAHPDEMAQLQGLWMLQAFNASLAEVWSDLGRAADARVRAAAVRALTIEGEAPLATLATLVADAHPRVRLEAVRALGSIRTAEAAALALSVLERPLDPFIEYAVWLTVNELAQPWLEAVRSGAWVIDGRERQLEFGLKALEPAVAGEVLARLVAGKTLPRDGTGPWIDLIGTAGGPAELGQLLEQLVRGGFDDDGTVAALTALAEAARLRGLRPAGELATFGALFEAPAPAVRQGALQLTGAWRLQAFVPQVVGLAARAESSPDERRAAFEALRVLGGSPEVIEALQRLVRTSPVPDVQRAAAIGLARHDLAATMPEVLSVLRTMRESPAADELWRGLLGIRGAGAVLAQGLARSPLPPEAAQAGLRPAREGNQHQALVEVLLQQSGLSLANTRLSPAERQALAREAEEKGNPRAGEHVYRRPELACIACHAIGGAGGKVGPDLTSIGASAPIDYLVESLLEPNAKIKEGYHPVVVTTRDQQVMSGTVLRENERELILRDAADREVSVPKALIADVASGGSLMPAGLIDTLLPEERRDLVKFLSELGKPGPFDAAKAGTARFWRLYRLHPGNTHLGVEPVIRGDFTVAGWEQAFSLVNGEVPTSTFQAVFPQGMDSRGLFFATQFQSQAGRPVSFQLRGQLTDGWINGKPFVPAATFTVHAAPGLNTLVLRARTVEWPVGVALESPDVVFMTE